MIAGTDTGAPVSRGLYNVVAYDGGTGEILQCALMRPHRVQGFAFPGEVLFLLQPREVKPEAEMVDPQTLALVPRPKSGLEGQEGAAPLAVDLAWCPSGAHLILQNEDGETMVADLPLTDELILTDPGRYAVTLRGAFPFQDFIGEIKVTDA